MQIADLEILQGQAQYPSITITLPTHRTFPEKEKDPVRVKNLIREVEDRLLQEYEARDIQDIMQKLWDLADSIDHNHNLEGMMIIANREVAKVYKLPTRLEEKVTVAEDFLVRDLLLAQSRVQSYWVLTLAENPTRLFHADNDQLQEVQDYGFPFVNEDPGTRMTLDTRYGTKPDSERDEHLRIFFRNIDAGLKQALDLEDLPVVLLGVDKNLGFFKEVAQNYGKVLTVIEGNHDLDTADNTALKLSALVWPRVQEVMHEQTHNNVAQSIDDAVSSNTFFTDLNDIWVATLDGRGAKLFVEEGFSFTAKVSEDGRSITVVDEPEAYRNREVLHDAVNRIIEHMLQTSGEVIFVEPGRLGDSRQMFLTLRY